MVMNILISLGLIAVGILIGISSRNYFKDKNGGVVSRGEFNTLANKLRELEIEAESKEFEYKKAVIHYVDGPSTKVDVFEDVERVMTSQDTLVVHQLDRRSFYNDDRIIKVELI